PGDYDSFESGLRTAILSLRRTKRVQYPRPIGFRVSLRSRSNHGVRPSAVRVVLRHFCKDAPARDEWLAQARDQLRVDDHRDHGAHQNPVLAFDPSQQSFDETNASAPTADEVVAGEIQG